MITFAIPHAFDKDLATAYNKTVEACTTPYLAICDRDILFTSPYYADRITQTIQHNGEAFYTCKTNRAACRWQLAAYADWANDNVKDHAYIAENLWQRHGTATSDHTKSQPWSGFLMVIPVRLWRPLEPKMAILGVDNLIHKMANRVLLMEGTYVYHWYRGGNRADKRHLQ